MTDLIDAAAWSVVRGDLLFHLDLAQILAIDSLPPGAADSWVVDVGEQGYVVTVLSGGLDHETFAVTFTADGAPIIEPRDQRASPRTITLASARRTALDQLEDAARSSVITLPPAATATPGAPLEAYLLGRDPGDDRRLMLSADGRHLLTTAPVASALAPTEAHVYRSLKYDRTLEFTTANGARWRVAAGQISRLD